MEERLFVHVGDRLINMRYLKMAELKKDNYPDAEPTLELLVEHGREDVSRFLTGSEAQRIYQRLNEFAL